ncbi:MAG: DUF4347 domain-containing protein, partial [Beijerinckiaceae bacterium]
MLADLNVTARVVVLDSTRDGVEQMAAALSGESDISAIHIISHGQSGNLHLGRAELTQETMQGQYADEFAAIRDRLSADADILLYGCDVGDGASGRDFVAALSQITRADIAASNDLTGSATYGGDWILEESIGVIDSRSLSADAWTGTLVAQTINPTGGDATDGSDGLRVFITNDGQFQVLYRNLYQAYASGTVDSNVNLFNGMYMRVGTQVVGPDMGAESITGRVAWTSGGAQTQTGSGTASDPWIVTTTMFYDANTNTAYDASTDIQAIVTTTYVAGRSYFTQSVTINAPATNTAEIKWYQAQDGFPGGQDNGVTASTDVGGNISAIGAVGTGTDGNIYRTFIAEDQGGLEFSRYFSGTYNSANLYNSGIGGVTGDIVNTTTATSIDIGLGAQWNLGVVTGSTTFSYHIAFSADSIIDLDSNDSTQTGTGYTGEYIPGGSAVGVVDADSKIINVVGDVTQTAVAIANASAGDILTIAGILPTGITVSGAGTSSLILSGVATEADYQIALGMVRFSTTSSDFFTRVINFQSTNQIGVASNVAQASIAIDPPPILDLNSTPSAVAGAPSNSTSNLVVNGGFGTAASATPPSPWIEGNAVATNAVVLNGSDGRYDWVQTPGATTTLTQAITVPAPTSLVTSATSSSMIETTTSDQISSIAFGLAWQNDDITGANNNILRVSYNGITYAEFTTFAAGTQNAAGLNGTWVYFNGSSGPATTASVTNEVTGALTTVTIALPTGITSSGNLVFSYLNGPSGAGIDDIAIDNVVVTSTRTTTTSTTVADTADNNWAATFTQNGTAVAIADIDSSIYDHNDAHVTSGVITLTNPQSGDRLLVGGSAAASGTINGISYTNTGTVVTLTGLATKADYADTIEAITFEHTTGAAMTGVVRDIAVQISDNGNLSNIAHAYITVLDPAPVLDLDGSSAGIHFTTSYTENGSGVSIADTDAILTDTNDANMESATVTLANQQTGDRLLVNGSAAASGTLVSGIAWTRTDTVVTLTGSFTTTQYLAALQLVQFANTTDSPSTTARTINVVVNDGTSNSVTAVTTVTVTPVNDAPAGTNATLTTAEDTAYTFAAATFGFTDPNDSPAHALQSVIIT